MSPGRLVAFVILSLVMFPAALLAAGGVAIGGCWHDCGSTQISMQLVFAAAALTGVAGHWAAGWFVLRQRSLWPFIVYCLILLVVGVTAMNGGL